MTNDNFNDAARAEAEALVDDIICWDDSIATDGPCDGTWDSLAAHLTERGWARTHLAAQEPTDAECIAVLNAVTTPFGEKPGKAEWAPAAIRRCREAMMTARAARRDGGTR